MDDDVCYNYESLITSKKLMFDRLNTTFLKQKTVMKYKSQNEDFFSNAN
jgi:hypothetical protein